MQPGEGATAAEEEGREAPDHPPRRSERVPLWLSLLRLPPPQLQPFVLCPDQTAQLFILTKGWGFPEQIVNKQVRLLLCKGGSLAWVTDDIASLKCKCCAMLYPNVYPTLTGHHQLKENLSHCAFSLPFVSLATTANHFTLPSYWFSQDDVSFVCLFVCLGLGGGPKSTLYCTVKLFGRVYLILNVNSKVMFKPKRDFFI